MNLDFVSLTNGICKSVGIRMTIILYKQKHFYYNKPWLFFLNCGKVGFIYMHIQTKAELKQANKGYYDELLCAKLMFVTVTKKLINTLLTMEGLYIVYHARLNIWSEIACMTSKV